MPLTEKQGDALVREYFWLVLHSACHEYDEGTVCRFCDAAYDVTMGDLPDGQHFGPHHVSQERREQLALAVADKLIKRGGEPELQRLLTLLWETEEHDALALFYEEEVSDDEDGAPQE